MIKDNIKWTSLMLPEHIRLLRQLIEENRLGKKPILDGQQMQQLGLAAFDSLNLTIPVRTIYWKDGLFDTKIGIVADVDMLNREIIVDLLSGSISIPIDHLVAIERV
ncbi:YolD-like family protein [Peribacillus sp. B-H-3]|uniref:YolD-like family protein n=1 Tax=Peribacillus sp. B-H-3 TaxID=3400420 RepID=UPI003B010DBE